MPVYIFREGHTNIFKIGKTDNRNVDYRRAPLNTGNSAGLRKFAEISTDEPLAMEAFLHRLLQHRNVKRDGGKDFFEMTSENHMAEVISRAEPMFQRGKTARSAVASLEETQCQGKFLDANSSDHELAALLRELSTRLQELEDEAAFIKFEKEMIECELKARIGNGPGIAGIATWESEVTKRFCEELFQEKEPEIYSRVLARFRALDLETWRQRDPLLYNEVTARHPKLDTSAWKTQDSRLYKQMQTTYFNPLVKRKFIFLA